MSQIGTKYVNSAATEEKIRTLTRKNPSLGRYLGHTFGATTVNADLQAQQSQSNTQAAAAPQQEGQLDRYTKNVIQTLFSVEVATNEAITSATSTVAGGIASIGDDVSHGINGLKEQMHELLKPVSSVTGSTIGTLTNVARDPLGAPMVIGNALGSLIDKVNPGFTDKLDATFKKYKVQEMQNLPGQIMGSIRNLASMADAILSVPFQLAADLYNGLMEIMQEISDLIDSVVSSVMDLFFGPKGILDSILPISELMGFLEEVGELASFVGGIGQMFGGFNMVTNITSQVQGYVSQAQSVLSNPAQLAMQYVPAEFNQYYNMVRNPQGVINSMIPPEISQQVKQISKIPGLGFVGNFGTGLGSTLEGLSDGVFTQALNSFGKQAGILSPLFNQGNSAPPVYDGQTEHPPTVEGASTNPKIAVAQGVPVVLEPPPKVLAEKASQAPVTVGNPNAAPNSGTENITVKMPDDMQMPSQNPISLPGVTIGNPNAAPSSGNVSVSIPASLRFP